MKHLKVLLAFCFIISTCNAVGAVEPNSVEGMINVASPFDVETTVEKFESLLESKNIGLFKRINHSHAVSEAKVDITPAFLIIFGNPKIGTPLMQCGITIGIDLPQKAMVWQDKQGKVWLSYNSPTFLAKRHGLKGCANLIEKLEKSLHELTNTAVSK